MTDDYDELLAENAALRETLGKTLDALECQWRRAEGMAPRTPINAAPGSRIGEARRILGRPA